VKSRRRAREAALQALYQCDTLQDWSEAAVDLYFTAFQSEHSAVQHPADMENCTFARELVMGVASHLAEIDDQIAGASTRWSINRMCRVDRNLLRLAAYEIAYLPQIPVSVTINEAIEIAKRYGTDDSPMFINGVLDNLATLWCAPGKRTSIPLHTNNVKKSAAG